MRKNLKQYYLKVLEDTKNFYSADVTRRSTDIYNYKNCLYRNPEGKACAIGRFLTPEKAFACDNEKDCGNSAIGIWKRIRNLKAFKGTSKRFWRALQIFHDDNDNWKNDGLTEAGLQHYSTIKQNIKDNVYRD